MMSGHERFSYHQADDVSSLYKRRSAVTGAPYVLCIFILGVILMGVGTFITSHALEDHPKDSVFMIVGPVLLGLGGLLLLGSVIICIVACCRNSQVQEAFSDELLNIGSSTFYGGRGFSYLVNEDQLQPNAIRQHHNVSDGLSNLAGPSSHCGPEEEGVLYLANTVAEERDRQRKYSRKYISNVASNNASEVCKCHAPSCNHHPIVDQREVLRRQMSHGSRTHLDYLGLEKLRRADPYPELARDFDLGEGPSPKRNFRDRSASVYTRQQGPSVTGVPHRLKRNITYSAATRGRAVSRRQQRQLEQQKRPSPQWRRTSSKRRAKERKDTEAPDNITIHQLPQFDPNLLNALGIMPNGGSPEPEYSSDPARASPNVQARHRILAQMPSENTHGSLGHPRRRPSMVMGVRGLNMQPSGSAYRHRSSIYASDMSLHRNMDNTMVREEENITGNVHEQEQYLGPPLDGCSVPVPSPFTTGSNPDIESHPRSPQEGWSSSRCHGRESPDSTHPRSLASSCCGSHCNSKGSLQFSCSGCDTDCDGGADNERHRH